MKRTTCFIWMPIRTPATCLTCRKHYKRYIQIIPKAKTRKCGASSCGNGKRNKAKPSSSKPRNGFQAERTWAIPIK